MPAANGLAYPLSSLCLLINANICSDDIGLRGAYHLKAAAGIRCT